MNFINAPITASQAKVFNNSIIDIYKIENTIMTEIDYDIFHEGVPDRKIKSILQNLT
jgi:hypothetical protein